MLKISKHVLGFATFLVATFLTAIPSANANPTVRCYSRASDIPSGTSMMPSANGLFCDPTPPDSRVGVVKEVFYPRDNGRNVRFVERVDVDQIVVPRYAVEGRPFVQRIEGRRMQCTLTDRGITSIKTGFAVGALTWLGEEIVNAKNHKVSALATVGGMAEGFINCDPMAEEELRDSFSGSSSQMPRQQASGGNCKNDRTGESRRVSSYEECKSWIGGEVRINR